MGDIAVCSRHVDRDSDATITVWLRRVKYTGSTVCNTYSAC